MTIPADLSALPTMAAIMAVRGDVPEPLYACRCKRQLDPESFVCTDDLGDDTLPRFVCATCASHAHRVALAAQAAAQAAMLTAWDTEEAKACKAERDRRVNATLWTTAEGSPLTEECRAAWTSWRIAMHRLTVDWPGPGEATWPDEPGLDYETT